MIQPIYNKQQELVINIISEFRQKEEKCLIHIVRELFGLPINEKTGKRITCLTHIDRPHYKKYIWDYGTEFECFLMEWDLVFPELSCSTINYIPTIHVNSGIPLDDLI